MRAGGRAGGIALMLVLGAIPAAAQTSPVEDRRAADAAMHSMSRPDHDMAADQHLLLSAPRPATPADSARATELVRTIRSALAKYRDVSAALTDGYQQFLPGVPQPVYHFNNWVSGFSELFGFDPARPTSLLYRKNADSSYTLTGVMYSAPRSLDEAALNQRIPLSIARWHQHVNWCVPKQGEQPRWVETRDGKPVFGPESPITTRDVCVAAGGRFVPHLFGWMVHVNAFESDDPQVIWGDHHH